MEITRKQLMKIASLANGRPVDYSGPDGKTCIGLVASDVFLVGKAARTVLGKDMAFKLAGCLQRENETIYFPGWSLSNPC